MTSRRGHRTFTSWIALFAILTVTFAPSLASLRAATRGLGWAEVCSAATPAAAPAGKSGEPSPGTPHTFEHCPYCALHADLAPPPRPRQAGAAMAATFRAYPEAFVRAPRATPVWASAQPRAPPFLA